MCHMHNNRFIFIYKSVMIVIWNFFVHADFNKSVFGGMETKKKRALQNTEIVDTMLSLCGDTEINYLNDQI